MSDKPILFSPPMVRGLIREVEHPGTGKTQTRRIGNLVILNDDPSRYSFIGIVGDLPYFAFRDLQTGHEVQIPCRFKKGDRLWVREAWRCNGWAIDVATIFYRASEGDGYTAMCEQWPVADHKPLRVETKWSPSLHLPRWASRLTLTVTDVRVQRLTDIDEIDAMAEGIIRCAPTDDDAAEFMAVEGGDVYSSAVDAYEALWNRINGALAWKANPWVVAVSFAVERRNIDAARAA